MGPVEYSNPESQVRAGGGPLQALRSLPLQQRWIVYISLFLLGLILAQMLVLVPVILIRYGWGYAPGFASHGGHIGGGNVPGQIFAEAWRIGLGFFIVAVVCLAWAWLIKNFGPI